MIYLGRGGTTEAASKGHQDDVNDHDHDHDDSVPPLPSHLTPLLPSTGRLDVEHVFSRLHHRRAGRRSGRLDRFSRVHLRRRLVPGSVARVHANHPEPPTQVVEEHDAEEKDEPAHMMRASTMEAVVDCLRPEGRGELIVVTDNWWYAKLILNTAAGVVRRRAGAASGGSVTNLEQTPLDADPDLDPALSAPTHGGQRLVLYEGRPGPSVGHEGGSGEGGTSYFDRLWRTGAGRHSRTKRRFVVALRTTSKTTTTTTATTASKQRTITKAQALGGR